MLNRRQILLGAGASLLTASTQAFGNGGASLDGSSVVTTGPNAINFPYFPSSVVRKAQNYFHPTLWSGSTRDLDTAMVCAVDISVSIDNQSGEYQAQMDALIETIASDEFWEALLYKNGRASFALCVVDFDTMSGLVTPWADFRGNNRDNLKRYADEIAKYSRRSMGSTDQGCALEHAAFCYAMLPCVAEYKSVNVLTDGNGVERNTSKWRYNLAKYQDATVYALTTRTSPHSTLDDWCEKHLITPADTFTKKNGKPLSGGFVHEVATEDITKIATVKGNAAKYNGEMLKAFIRQITIQTAGLDINDPAQCTLWKEQCIRHAAWSDQSGLNQIFDALEI